MSLDWIRRNYLVQARRGARVAYDATLGAPRHGTIVGARQQYLKVLMDGDSKPGLYHPTWCIRFLGATDTGTRDKGRNLGLNVQRDQLQQEPNGEKTPSDRQADQSLLSAESVSPELLFVGHIDGMTAQGGEPLLGDVDAEVRAPGEEGGAEEVQDQADLVEVSNHA